MKYYFWEISKFILPENGGYLHIISYTLNHVTTVCFYRYLLVRYMTGDQNDFENSLSRSLNLFSNGTNLKLTFLSKLIEILHICPKPESWQRKCTTAVRILKHHQVQ